jgi:hypothetical protein
MDFVTVLEFNHKENEATLHYCQWQGNGAELEKLFAAIELAEKDQEFASSGHVSTFKFQRALIPEAAVQAHLALKYGSFTHMFQRHVGVFKCPPFTSKAVNEAGDEYVDAPMTDPRACALRLDDLFYGARLGQYFRGGPD